VFGNGGADTIAVGATALTAIGGQGGDLLQSQGPALVFGNEGND
jgi:hypothetical protein